MALCRRLAGGKDDEVLQFIQLNADGGNPAALMTIGRLHYAGQRGYARDPGEFNLPDEQSAMLVFTGTIDFVIVVIADICLVLCFGRARVHPLTTLNMEQGWLENTSSKQQSLECRRPSSTWG